MKVCKHKWKAINVEDEASWFDKLFYGIFASRRKVITLCCENCGECKSSNI